MSDMITKHQEILTIAKKERKIKWSYYDYFIMSFLSFLGVGLLVVVWKLIF